MILTPFQSPEGSTGYRQNPSRFNEFPDANSIVPRHCLSNGIMQVKRTTGP